MNTVAITGASGLIATALRRRLEQDGTRVLRISRKPDLGDGNTIKWNPVAESIDRESLEGIDALFHLAGENIASGRWTADKKRRIVESRVQSTRFIAETLAALKQGPKVFVSASATGIYGDTGDTIADEETPAGQGFLADVCRQWEDAARPAVESGIRTVHPRFAMVLTPEGGALKQMLSIFRLGLGGPIGRGRQWISWVSMHDAVEAMMYLIKNPEISGPVNITSPHPARQKDFARSLGRALKRPAFLPAPPFALRLMFGQMAEELLLSSSRIRPSRLDESAYVFGDKDLESCLPGMLEKKSV